MNKIKGIIFDMDGVLVDTERISFMFWKQELEKYKKEMSRELYGSVIGRNKKGVFEILKSEFGSELPLEEIYSEKVNAMLKHLDENDLPVKLGVYEIFDFLQDSGYKVALATSTFRKIAVERLERIGLREGFDTIVCGDDINNSKPDPEIFIKAATQLGLEPKDCLVLEDSPAGIEAAFKAGIRVINIPDLKDPDEIMRERACKICNDLLEVKEYLLQTK